ncbi:lysophospholipid acyltransferase family protein [Antrihabitans stalactiti]|uniref:1-acyl-sn-glycerol-3-phosphate acyltransferase n=1 Tax=Antrihabitans stalactiti TaxID=2584121 RepID=A0A848KF73_9NOCA|nr:1-acyl-sn-glycerol-3-phosphate acyltransferase [Antrihabitans stalactiti]NMN95362.1 1-acyl-sn-glycerol-3-phosphate acyltransferase [Antrihabitans stalactiti]
MEPPEVTLENYEAVYDYYLTHQQNVLRAKASYSILNLKYRPRIHYRDGAKAQLRELIKSGTPLIYAMNHLSTSDPYTLSALAAKTPLRKAIGHIRVLAKDELFVDPEQRRKVDMMGGIPVFRGKNHGLRAVNAAGQRMMDICAERMKSSDHIAVFPEGTCNVEDPTKVQTVGSGIGHITSRAMKLGVNPAMIYIGLSYGPTQETVKNASFFIDTPVTDLPVRPIEITREVVRGMQAALDEAVARY